MKKVWTTKARRSTATRTAITTTMTASRIHRAEEGRGLGCSGGASASGGPVHRRFLHGERRVVRIGRHRRQRLDGGAG